MELSEATKLAESGEVRVRTTEPLGVRVRVAGEFESEYLAANTECVLACEDEPGTFILLYEHPEYGPSEVWGVAPVQIEPLP